MEEENRRSGVKTHTKRESMGCCGVSLVDESVEVSRELGCVG